MSFVVYPAVDISEGRCVRLLQGRFGAETVYSDDPVEVALGFCRAGAHWLHVVDLDGARIGEPVNREIVLEVARLATCPVQVSGGLRSAEDVTEVLAAGGSRAVLGTVALEDREELGRACSRFGERIIVSLDVRAGELQGRGWTVGSGIELDEAISAFDAAGVGGYIYTDISRDGTMAGPDLAGLESLTHKTSRPVIASGGIASLEDVKAVARLHSLGVQGVIVGRALYERKFSLRDAQIAADEALHGRPEPPLVEAS